MEAVIPAFAWNCYSIPGGRYARGYVWLEEKTLVHLNPDTKHVLGQRFKDLWSCLSAMSLDGGPWEVKMPSSTSSKPARDQEMAL